MQFYFKKMILGIGTDLILIERIAKLILQFKEKFIEKIFTQNEILQVKNSSSCAAFYAKRFAAKEACSKAIGLGIGRGIDFKDIEILNDDFGKPQIKILNGKENFLAQHFGCKNFAIHLSLTDEKKLASAFVIIEKLS